MQLSPGILFVSLPSDCLSVEDRQLLLHPSVVGVVLFAANYRDTTQFIDFIREILSLRQPSLLIAMDHEGGRVSRLKEYDHSPLTDIFPMAYMGEIYQNNPIQALQLSESVGKLHAYELRSLGIDLSFSPVLDIDYALSSVIGQRAFSGDVDAVIALTSSFILGMKSFGMSAVGKHYPGHGGVAADTHLDSATDSRSLDVLLMNDLKPYKVLSGLLGGVMTAHVRFPSVSPDLPFYSQEWLSFLREACQFQGAIMSDDLMMAAAQESSSTFWENITLAIQRGCDFFILCHNREMMLRFCDTVDLPSVERRRAAYDSLRSSSFLKEVHADSYEESYDIVSAWQEKYLCSE